MATVRDILATKGTDVLSVSPKVTALDAARQMNTRGVGSLMVVDDGRLVGIFTERDILRRIVAVERDPSDVLVEEVMSAEVACALPETTIDECRAVMKARHIRYLPVLDEARNVCGVVSITDLNAHDASAQDVTIFYLNEYLHGANREALNPLAR